ncbi:MAG: DUF4433 domain-containing protein [Acidimicrobiales bacterium]|nr:DUF4433 domain-containing protein [Acidimicrobiales bacterium]MYB80059.1 DUF4433 domain-containing protein [Acidimicrobiales bacterium]MYI12430.1 DUF4433 domain-containing protein [Acidimicrobiales bacterium]
MYACAWGRAVKRSKLTELHYICHVDNLPSILAKGILSHRRAQRLQPMSIANEEVQDRRAEKSVPRGQPLHSYANLYLNARNPMMYRITDASRDVANFCVLSVSTTVLDLDGVVLADGNAASAATAFRPALEGLAAIKRKRVFAQYWTHQGDQVAEAEHKRVMCAEILVPSAVDAAMIDSVYVANDEVAASVSAIVANVRAVTNGYLFFRRHE